jgi:threonylcarbamoyladenosine tRNA methylthiotransferase MtaB
MPEIDFVVPNEAKDGLVDLVGGVAARRMAGDTPASKLPDGVAAVTDNRQSHFKSSITLFDKADSRQTRAFVKIQDGCDGFCSYCLIPYARGQSRSVPSDAVVTEVARLTSGGSGEIVLTGIHIGDYGRDLDEFKGVEHPIVLLLERLFALSDLKRLRISSLEPAELSSELVNCLAAHRDQVCDHLHLPLQSGSDRILKLMRRQYTTAEYAAAVEMFRDVFPNASIGADVIPGFPSETDAEHDETIAFIKGLGLSYLHVFPYSKRPNTAAARMPHHLPGDVVSARAASLRDLSKSLQDAYARDQIGRVKGVIWEKDQDSQGRRIGLTTNYVNVVAPRGVDLLPGTLSQVELKGLVEQGRLLARLA